MQKASFRRPFALHLLAQIQIGYADLRSVAISDAWRSLAF